MSTPFLYHQDAYLKECEAKVVSIEPDAVVLDNSIFYPTSGGQECDIGTIGECAVVKTLKMDADIEVIDGCEMATGGVIKHYLDQAPTCQIGDSVKLTIDWPRRLKTMRLHAMSHILDHFLTEMLPGVEYVASHVDCKKDRSDYRYPEAFSRALLDELAQKCNDFVDQEHDITFSQNGAIRVWCCDNIKTNCAGLHVKNTREIGHIKLKRKNKGANLERIEMTLL